MDSTQIKHTLSDMVFDIKQKLTDEEYKNIMDKIAEQKKCVKIRYMLIEASVDDDNGDCCPYADIDKTDHHSICEVLKEPNKDSDFTNIQNCVVEPNIYEDWKAHKDDKSFWPQAYHFDNSYILVCEFEEL